MMRVSACVIGGLLIAASVTASPVTYVFSGTLGRFSTLTLADGRVIDLSGAPFTAQGTTGEARQEVAGLFTATTVYDFGQLGSFAMDPNADGYLQEARDGALTQVGLIAFQLGNIDGRGFRVRVPSVPVSDLTQPVAFGTVAVAYSSGLDSRVMINATGERFFQSHDLIGPLTIDAVTVTATPEPASVLMLALGGAILLGGRRRSRGPHG